MAKPSPTKNTPAVKPVAASKTAVMEKKTMAVAVAGLNMEADAGGGFENATKDSFAIPYIVILQSMSPQCKKSEGAYIKGAEEGMLINSVTSEVLDGQEEGIVIVPCAYKYAFVEWITRENGGGFIAEHDPVVGAALQKTSHKDDKGRDILPNGHQLNPTHSFFVLVVDEETGVHKPAVISCTSTQIKFAKRWMTLMNQLRLPRADGSLFQPPMFSHSYNLLTVAQSNEKGSWFGWQAGEATRVDITTPDGVALYTEARAFKESVNKGEVRVAQPEQDGGGPTNIDPDDM